MTEININIGKYKRTVSLFLFLMIFFSINSEWGNILIGPIELDNLITLIVLMFAFFITRGFKEINITKDLIVVLIFILYIHVSSVYHGLIKFYSYGIIFVFLKYFGLSIFLKLIDDHRKVLKYILFAVLTMMFIGYIEKILGHTFYAQYWQGGERYNENGSLVIGSTVGSPNYASLILVAIFPLVLYLKKTSREKWIYNIIIYLCLFFTYILFSRTGFLLMAITLLLLAFPVLLKAFYKFNFFLVYVVIILFSTYSISTGGVVVDFITTNSMDDRSLNYRSLIVMLLITSFINSPIVGIGKGQFSEFSYDLVSQTGFKGVSYNNFIDTHPMNTYLGTLAELGIIGGILLLFYIRFFYKKTLKEIRENHSLLHKYLLISIIMILLNFLVIDAVYSPIVIIIFSLIANFSGTISNQINEKITLVSGKKITGLAI